MSGILDHGLIGLLLKVYGVLFVLGPIALRATFRYKAKVNPQLIAQEALPEDVRQFMAARLPGITALGFQPVGYVNVGSLAPNTEAYMALLSNAQTSEWADVSVVKAPTKMSGYIEFITRCSDDSQVDTNTNSIAPCSFLLRTIMSFVFRRSETPSPSTARTACLCRKTSANRGRNCRHRDRS